jgi:hypothetical protein
VSSYSDRLADMDEQYESAEARAGGASVPDGEYEGLIERFDFWERDGGGPLKLITEISVADGEYEGIQAPSVWHELEDPDRIGWTKGYLQMLGLEGVKLSELETALETVAGKTRVAVRVTSTEKNGRTYRNTYVNEVLGQGDDFAPEAEEEKVPL